MPLTVPNATKPLAATRLRVHATAFVISKDEAAPPDDSVTSETYPDGLFLAVLADGMGSARHGREAAQRVTSAFTTHFASRPRAWPLAKVLEEITRQLNRLLYQEGQARFGQSELGTTIVAALLDGNRLHVIHAGDSRCYLFRKGKLHQITQDHRDTNPGCEHHLIKALGMIGEITPDYSVHDLAKGDLVLLSSDGLSDVLKEDALTELLGKQSSARSLASTARERATLEQLDDISAVLVEVMETGACSDASESLPIAGQLKAGDLVDGFTLRRSFRESDRIWLASRAGNSYVLKFAPVEAATNEPLQAQFLREIWHATRLQAEYFPTAFLPDPCTYCYYAQEYLHAPNLRQYLKDHGDLAVEEAVRLGVFLLNAVQFLVRHDFVHGDLKPENIVVIGTGAEMRFKLIDLGSVAEVFSFNRRAGTPSYLAPERFHGAALSETTEIFAIGVTLYEALTGRLPFGEVEPFQTPVFRQVRPPSTTNHHIPQWLDMILLHSLAIEPKDRYLNYSEMLFDLEHPEKVRPFHQADTPLIQRDPLKFYKYGFYFLLITVIILLFMLLK
ncbi:MAG TPA: protein phosphatase 2C domain-containing protein [Verrucomicrobiae bacterium]